MRRRTPIAGLALALALSAGLWPALAPAPAAAATPKLTLVGETTYDVLPDEGRVAVSVRLTATNHLKDTPTRRYFFRTAFLTVLPGTSNFRMTGGSGTPKVAVRARTATYTNLRLDFGVNLAAGKSMTLDLRFDLKDAGGAPGRPVRISPSLVTFQAWAHATPQTPGATVVILLPTGYHVTVGQGPMEGPVADETGHDRWSAGPLATPLTFAADVAADKPFDYDETTREVDLTAGAATILLRSWPDDVAWRDRVAALIDQALPILEREIGVPWPVDGPLAVHEALVRRTGGYAGLFDPAQRRIEIAYAAPDVVVLHELAHAWFNGGLVADRWVAEAFASYYADLAADELGLAPAPPMPEEPSPERIQLNAWGPAGSDSPGSEIYAYAASLELAETIGARAGPEALQRVWDRAARGIAAYQPDPSAEEPSGSPPDWRGLLDLLEGETGETFDDLWRTWVARPQDIPALEQRVAARELYAYSVDLAGEWRLPLTIREAMRAWRYDVAVEQLTAADAVLAQRAALEESAANEGLALPGSLREAFEGDAGLVAAATEANAQQATVDLIAAARAARPIANNPVDELVLGLGLLGEDPEGKVAEASTALASGEITAAYTAAHAAESAWSSAADVGRSRIVSAALLAFALVLFAGMLGQVRRRRSAEPG